MLSAALSVQEAFKPPVPHLHEARYPMMSGLSSTSVQFERNRGRPGSDVRESSTLPDKESSTYGSYSKKLHAP